jgi:hypothetical protein
MTGTPRSRSAVHSHARVVGGNGIIGNPRFLPRKLGRPPFVLVYEELCRLARMVGGQAGHTAIVHEAYLKLIPSQLSRNVPPGKLPLPERPAI